MSEASGSHNHIRGIDVSNIVDFITPEQRRQFVTRSNRLRVEVLREYLAAGNPINPYFVEVINQTAPGYNLPSLTSQIQQAAITEAGPSTRLVEPEHSLVIPATRNIRENIPLVEEPVEEVPFEELEASDSDHSVEDGVEADSVRREVNNPNQEIMAGDDQTNTSNRIKWASNSLYSDVDPLNVRNADGTLKPLVNHTDIVKEGEHELVIDAEIPESIATQEFRDNFDAIRKVNGQQAYDSEALALGVVKESEYFLLPSNWPIPICEVKDWCTGLDGYDVNPLIMIGIYVLAREQGITMGFDEDKAIKWACIRLESFKAGWFNHQKYTKFVKCPPNPVSVFTKDKDKIPKYCHEAYKLTAYVPFYAEFHFRSYGNSYSSATSADYLTKAEKLCHSALLGEYLDFIDKETLFGKSMAWIGVRRVREVLECDENESRYPNVFFIRKTSAPAGQAPITTAAAAIRSLMSCGWWEGIKEVAKYKDEGLLATADMITASPWRFHMMYSVYGVAGPSDDEKKMVAAARLDANMMAPILQAFIETGAKGTDLGKAKALKKLANQNIALYHRALRVFRAALRKRATNVSDLFANDVFEPRKRKAEAQKSKEDVDSDDEASSAT